jgi:short-subunit dehydrogenase
MSDLSGRTTVVVGASRGPGRGIAMAFAEAGAPVVAVSRTAAFRLREALLKPLRPGSRVVVMSSGAGLETLP